MEEIKPGLVINDRYKLLEYKGSGSFGEVWLARDLEQNKDIAIKIYISLDRKGCEEFLAEYKIASGLKHKNLLVTEHYDVWNNRPFLTMKYCGKGAASLLVDKLKPCKKDELIIWKFIRDVAAGLVYLHNLDPDPIVHQDIKPDNVLLDNDGSFLITDFGISKRVRDTLRSQSTRAQKAGATAYMAPERFSKKPAPILASDIWSLGASIYELAEGCLPFNGMGGVMLKNGAEMAELSDGWTRNLNDIMVFCLEKESWDRGKAHEIKKIADEVIKNDLGANVSRMIHEIKGVAVQKPKENDPHKTKRNAHDNPQNKSFNKTKDESNSSSTKSNKKKRFTLLTIFAILIISFTCIYRCYFAETDEMKEAKSRINEYVALKEDCRELVASGDNSKPDVLLSAKRDYEELVEFENKYSSLLPDIYVHSSGLEDTLNLKLEDAALAWATAAKSQATELADYSNAIDYYQLAVKLSNSKEIAQEYDNIIRKTAYMQIKSISFVRDETNRPVPTYSIRPTIKYNGLCEEEQSKLLKFKVIRSSGALENGSKLLSGYSYEEKVKVKPGDDIEVNLKNWETENYIGNGTAIVEIWYDNRKIYSTDMVIVSSHDLKKRANE